MAKSLLAALFATLLVVSSVLMVSASASQVQRLDPQLLEFVKAGGSISDLCVSDHAGNHDHRCPFCREIDAFDLAPCPAIVVLWKRVAEKCSPTEDTPHTAKATHVPWFARGPPTA